MYCHSASSEGAAAARELGLPCGKYRAFLELRKLDPDITPEEVCNMTMRQIRELIVDLSGNGNNEATALGGGQRTLRQRSWSRTWLKRIRHISSFRGGLMKKSSKKILGRSFCSKCYECKFLVKLKSTSEFILGCSLKLFFVYGGSNFDLTFRLEYAMIVLDRNLIQCAVLLHDHIFDHRQA